MSNTFKIRAREERREMPEDPEGSEEIRFDVITLKVGDTHDDTLRDLVDDHWPAEHCQHEHDCCGHWYQGRAKIERSGRFAIVTLGYSCNI